MSIEERLDHNPEPWKPSVGDKLVGTVVELDSLESKFGGTYPLVIVGTDAGEIAVHGFHAVLKSELARRRPKVGDRIGIAYHGKHDKASYEVYRVIVGRAEPEAAAEPNWDAIADEARDEMDVPPPSDADAPAEEISW